MKFDKHDNPQVRSEGLDIGPSSMMPTSVRSGEAISEGLNEMAQGALAFRTEGEKASRFLSRQAEMQFAEEAGTIESEFRNRQDETALDTAPVREKIEAARQKYADRITDPKIAEEYKLRTGLRIVAMNDGLEKHAANQRVKVYGAVADKAFEDMRKRAVKDYNSPDKVEIALKLGLSTMMEYLGGHLKLPDAQVDLALERAQAKVYADVLHAYEAGKQFTAGKAYLATIKESLGADAPAWEAAFNKLSDDAENEALATTAWADVQQRAIDPVSGRFNPNLAREWLTGQYDPEQRARIEGEVEREITTAVNAQAAEDVQRIARLSKKVRESGGFSRTDLDYARLDDLGQDKAQELIRAFSREQRSDDAQARREQAEMDSIAESQFNQIPTPEEQAALTPADIEDRYPFASQKMKERIKARAVTVQRVVKKSQQATYTDYTRAIAGARKGLSKKLGDQFDAYMRAWYDGLVMEDKIPTDVEVQKKINDALILRETWGSNKYSFQMDDPNSTDVADYQPQERVRAALSRPAPVAAQAPKAVEVKGSDLIKNDPKLADRIDPNATYIRQGNKLTKKK